MMKKSIEYERIADEIYLAHGVEKRDVMRAFAEYELETSFDVACLKEEL
jgi:hypothetical protein